MLREISAAHENNSASHMVSKSQLTTHNMPAPVALLSESDAARQPESDLRTVGAKTGQRPLENFRINLLA
ncbi:MAG: hypothetical protein K1X75_03390 [Leptospirales bacterium]|nr:hypothetical protein [Leptospirales bacterium]